MGQKPLQFENHPEHPEMRGKGLSAHMDVAACACFLCVCVRANRLGPAGDLLSMSPPTMIYLLHPYPTSPSTHTHTYVNAHMAKYSISSISVIR